MKFKALFLRTSLSFIGELQVQKRSCVLGLAKLGQHGIGVLIMLSRQIAILGESRLESRVQASRPGVRSPGCRNCYGLSEDFFARASPSHVPELGWGSTGGLGVLGVLLTVILSARTRQRDICSLPSLGCFGLGNLISESDF